jgi:hypothetical protein
MINVWIDGSSWHSSLSGGSLSGGSLSGGSLSGGSLNVGGFVSFGDHLLHYFLRSLVFSYVV